MRDAKGFAYLLDRVMAYREAKLILVANELDVFTHVDSAPCTARDLADGLGCDPRATEVLLHALVAIGLLRLRRGRFSNGPLARDFLVRGRPGYKGNNLRFQEMIWGCWSQLADVVRTGRSAADLGQLLSGQSDQFVQEYILGMHNIARRPAHEVAGLVDLRGARTMVDVGGGPGTFTMAFLERNPSLRAVILDLPTTLQVTKRCLKDFPGRRRVRLLPGDYTKDGFGRGHDFVWMSHVSHDEAPATNQAMIAKAHAALARGGRVAIHDFLVGEDKCSPPFSALFSVNMLVYTRGGACYPLSQYRQWLEEAGFRDVRTLEVLKGKVANASTVVLATKP